MSMASEVLPGPDVNYKWKTGALIESRLGSANSAPAGISVAGVNGLIYAEGFGYSDIARQIKATPDTLFCVASVSKIFTAMAVMQLEEKGKINLDRPVKDYIPEFMVKSIFNKTAPITVRMLLTHRSGLPSDRLDDMYTNDSSSFRDSIPFIRDHYLQNPPGLVFSYCNLGYAVLGVIIERVSGTDFYDYMKNNILVPLGMTNSTFLMTNKSNPLCARSYYSPGKDVQEPPYWAAPAAGLWTSPREMANFITMVLNGGTYKGKTILKAGTLKEMFRDDSAAPNLDFGYRQGLGWNLDNMSFPARGELVWHGGDTFSFFSMLKILPQSGVGVIYESDGNEGLSGAIANSALNEALRLENPPVIVKNILPEPDNYNMETNHDKITNVYSVSSGKFKVNDVKGSLFAEFVPEGNGDVELKPEKDGWFSGLGNSLIGFITIGGETYVVKKNGIRIRPYGKPDIINDVKIDWKALSGTYHVYKPDWHEEALSNAGRSSLLSLSASGDLGQVYLSSLGERLMLEPLTESTAVVTGFGNRYNGAAISITNVNGREMLELDGLLLCRK